MKMHRIPCDSEFRFHQADLNLPDECNTHKTQSCRESCVFSFSHLILLLLVVVVVVVVVLFRAVTNFSSRQGIEKSSRGTKKVWCYSCRLLLSGGGVKGLRKYNNFPLGFARFCSFKVKKSFRKLVSFTCII